MRHHVAAAITPHAGERDRPGAANVPASTAFASNAHRDDHAPASCRNVSAKNEPLHQPTSADDER